MTNEEFEKKWAENRNKVLANDDEYQRIARSYTSWGWVDYVIFIGGFVICENLTKTLFTSIILQYILAIVGMLLVWMGYRLIKSLISDKKTLEEAEEKARQRYRETL
ncbi:MAG: Fis family transcriptional regulator [Prevotella sp.]|nr:Fis family transcriptional regulator [Prevotella sp.]